jgi:hypothetical protein
MNKLFYKVIFEDIQNENCTEAETEALLNAFENTLKRMATTLARRSWYVLGDFATAKKYGIERFNLMIESKQINDCNLWQGVFECENKKLSVIATLEK